MQQKHELYMQRCLQLAAKGYGAVAPNPMVGAVLVYEDTVLSEGYHHYYGGKHAEVDCIHRLPQRHISLLPQCTLYVSLEPCCFKGKTPACTDLIISQKIKKVVIACLDPNSKVNGAGIEILKQAGVKVTFGVLEKQAEEVNKWFFNFHNQQRPFIILKWAQTANQKIAAENYQPVKISNANSHQIAHKWRTEIPAIWVGFHTVVTDNPELTSRLWPGNNPVRIVVDKFLDLPLSAKIFAPNAPLYIFNFKKEMEVGTHHFIKIKENEPLLPQILKRLYEANIQAVMVEGGTKTLQSFIDANLWDEARIITNTHLQLASGIAAPVLPKLTPYYNKFLKLDLHSYYFNPLQQK